MSIKDLPHVTVEQVLVLRKAAIELEKELSELKASLPKVRADTVKAAMKYSIDKSYTEDYFGDVVSYLKLDIDKLKEYIAKLEQGNE